MKRLTIALLFAMLGPACAQTTGNFYDMKDLGDAPYFWWPDNPPAAGLNDSPVYTSYGTLDAAGEKVAACGYLHINGGAATAKMTGGDPQASISFQPGTVAWTGTTTPTTLRIGLQTADVATGIPMRPSETDVVYGEISSPVGTDSLVSNTYKTVLMDTGAETTYNDGDLMCVVAHMTVEDSVATDSVIINGWALSASTGTPVISNKLGGGAWAVTNSVAANFLLSFDDGTLGWLEGSIISNNAATFVNTYNTGSSPDERGRLFTLPFDAEIWGIRAAVQPGGATSDFEIDFYTDPTGTPTLMTTKAGGSAAFAIAAETFGGSGTSPRYIYNRLSSPVIVRAGLPFVVSYRPTSANSITMTIPTVADNAHLAAWGAGIGSYMMTRSDNAGAFSAANTSVAPIYLQIKRIRTHNAPRP